MKSATQLLGAIATVAGIAQAQSIGQQADEEAIARMDTAYQLAVERNDWQAMDKILHADMRLVLGDGKTVDRALLIKNAKDQKYLYEKQVELPGTQVVRMYGKDTATVTALLWVKGKLREGAGSPMDFKLWFTDTYVRTADGWRYAFGQASLPLPNNAPK